MSGTQGRTQDVLDKRALDLLADWRDDRDSFDNGFIALIGRLVPWFEELGIDYLFGGSVASRMHGGNPGHCDARLLLTATNWQQIQQSADARFNVHSTPRSISAKGLPYGSTVEVHDILPNSVTIYGLRVLSLPVLIGRLLRRAGQLERDCVISLIRANGLTATFLTDLPSSRRTAFTNCLNRAQRRRQRKRS
jgi:hypothetical protein